MVGNLDMMQVWLQAFLQLNVTEVFRDKMGSTLALTSLRMQSKLEMPCRQHRCRTAKAALRALAHSCAMASLNPPCVSSERPRYLNWWTFFRALRL